MERRITDTMSPKHALPHSVHIETREYVSISGVKHVESFNEFEISLITDVGMLHVEGNELHITKLNVDDGQVVIEGEIVALEYSDYIEQKPSLFSRVFK